MSISQTEKVMSISGYRKLFFTEGNIFRAGKLMMKLIWNDLYTMILQHAEIKKERYICNSAVFLALSLHLEVNNV